MTLHWTDLVLILALVTAGNLAGNLLLTRRLKQIALERQLKIAEQLGTLDEAIRALETRIAGHHAVPLVNQAQLIAAAANQHEAGNAKEEDGVASKIQAVIAAAAVAALGPDAHVRSIKPAASPWSQQGRVLVQGSHNARAGR